MTICYECATDKGLVLKDKIVGVWAGKCPYCKKERSLCDEVHDYKYPGQQPPTLEDVLLYECNNPEEEQAMPEVTREQLKKHAQRYGNRRTIGIDSETINDMADLIATQDEYIDRLEHQIATINKIFKEVSAAPDCDQTFYQLRLIEKIIIALRNK